MAAVDELIASDEAAASLQKSVNEETPHQEGAMLDPIITNDDSNGSKDKEMQTKKTGSRGGSPNSFLDLQRPPNANRTTHANSPRPPAYMPPLP
jgi:hypothetical protein